MARHRRVVVIGASLAGVRAAQSLRDRGFEGSIVLVGAEKHLPYDRPPLSKGFLAGSLSVEEIQLLSSAELGALQLDLRLGRRALSLDPVGKEVTLDHGEVLRYDDLVIATGSVARRPRAWEPREGMFVLRTADDCLAIRAALRGSPHVVIVGAGFIGCEVASTARRLGCDVVVIEPLPAPMVRVLGTEVGGLFAEIASDAGVRLSCGTTVEEVEGTHRVERVRLGDGRTLDADVVVVGIGARPATDWLLGSRLEVADGVLCDGRGATSVPGVYAAGEVARWFNPRLGQAVRAEHWTSASEQGTFVARTIMEGPASAAHLSSVPFVWSDQFDVKIEIAGSPQPTDRIRVVEGTPQERRFVAVYERAEELTGVLAVNSTRSMLKYRRLLVQGGVRLDRGEETASASFGGPHGGS